MRYVLAPLGAVWFLFQSQAFVVPGVSQDGWPIGTLTGDPTAIGITVGVRVICFGLVLMALAITDWDELREWF